MYFTSYRIFLAIGCVASLATSPLLYSEPELEKKPANSQPASSSQPTSRLDAATLAQLDQLMLLYKNYDKQWDEYCKALAVLPESARLEFMCRVIEYYRLYGMETAFVHTTNKMPAPKGSGYSFHHDALKIDDVKYLMQNWQQREAYAIMLVAVYKERYVSPELKEQCHELLITRIQALTGQKIDQPQQTMLEIMCSVARRATNSKHYPQLLASLKEYAEKAEANDTLAMAIREWKIIKTGQPEEEVSDPMVLLHHPRVIVRSNAARDLFIRDYEKQLTPEALAGLLAMVQTKEMDWPEYGNGRYNAIWALKAHIEEPGVAGAALPVMLDMLPACNYYPIQGAAFFLIQSALRHVPKADQQKAREKLTALRDKSDAHTAKEIEKILQSLK